MDKKMFMAPEDMQLLAEDIGGCLATDRIIVDGQAVKFMYREHPFEDCDSGWRFLAGDEDDEYMDNHDHLGFYDVNTVANYEPKIVSLLEQPVGCAFARDCVEDEFEVVVEEDIADSNQGES